MSPPRWSRRILLAGALALLGPGCATVRSSWIRPDYEQSDRARTKRLVVVTQPLPAGDQKVGELWSVIARRYVNQKRDFIAKESRAVGETEGAFDPRSQCGEGLEGVLWLRPAVARKGDGFEAQVRGVLLRCLDGQPIWSAEAGGSYQAEDPGLKEITALYVSELGPAVAPHVAPAFNLLRPLLDTLPNPLLTEEDATEKIELGE